MAQINPLVGDVPGNAKLILETCKQALELYNASMVVFPELTLTAYPPEDLLLRPSVDTRVQQGLKDLCEAGLPCHIVVGYPGTKRNKLYNMLAVIHDGKIEATYRKMCLPNYQVFDEKRYFSSGGKPCVITTGEFRVAFTICEDLWKKKPMKMAAKAGANLMININGSPYHRNKMKDRKATLTSRSAEGQMPIIYVNQVGGQDELVFDGGSMAMNADGEVCVQAPEFETALTPVELISVNGVVSIPGGIQAALCSEQEGVYRALVLGVRDYINKNGFKGVVLGLSGGIDSALSLAVAVDALGADRVHAVMMPYSYTSEMSLQDAEEESRILGVNYRVIPIKSMVESFQEALKEEFAGYPVDVTEQNIQARCRGVTLMAISNKKGLLVLTTGNKSEMAVGYATLYGDMAGGFDVLKDVPKLMVYDLARFRNEEWGEEPQQVIPQRVIDRPPSAELAPDQVDEDNLPPYEILDQILHLYIEEDQSAHTIIEQGFDEAMVNKVIRLVDINEYKRRQAPIGPRISKRGFGRDRRYPVTSGWKPGK